MIRSCRAVVVRTEAKADSRAATALLFILLVASTRCIPLHLHTDHQQRKESRLTSQIPMPEAHTSILIRLGACLAVRPKQFPKQPLGVSIRSIPRVTLCTTPRMTLENDAIMAFGTSPFLT